MTDWYYPDKWNVTLYQFAPQLTQTPPNAAERYGMDPQYTPDAFHLVYISGLEIDYILNHRAEIP